MDQNDVQLIGVFGTETQPIEGFTYTVGAPTNLWIGALCDDGSRMSAYFMAYILNGLLHNDEHVEGGVFALRSNNGSVLLAEVGEEVPKGDVEANMADSATVRKVTVRTV